MTGARWPAQRHTLAGPGISAPAGSPTRMLIASRAAGFDGRATAQSRRIAMAKRQAQSVYRIVDVVGESNTSWEDAGRRAVETAASSIRDLRVAEVVKMDMKVEGGKVTAFRTRVALSFKYEA